MVGIRYQTRKRDVLSVDPFSSRVMYRFGGDTLAGAIDDDLNVAEVAE